MTTPLCTRSLSSSSSQSSRLQLQFHVIFTTQLFMAGSNEINVNEAKGFSSGFDGDSGDVGLGFQ
ncbi:hypothetical protein HanRHA438_Chr02g0067911 [Helianthus annuus]|uniref:Uncharacterized protein n=1 Tax=Helianthus annuus TaxID=4232 RepID=A0A251TM13_HELAN|nr:hypothetical protein HanXRQr2_Chr10g0451471 [Helianthus annuus]KAF5818565.1 hypothetical protein HanXRQr2_Chr02g0066801 [Helianthus annuus]KAJ0522822.1 hypothetical protein HanIR_Chr10g0486821 [Helianthus annuus]KAJ0604826.1 hypothetical protein HanHA300_Chr02g0054681 [Helianthus annuus]KAJ0618842.1 hypothetical protein HanHA89_Chr02g0058161 [Helianthus annuus]